MVTVIRAAAILIAGLALFGCSSLQMFTEGDLQNAAAIAQANGDVAGAQCASSLAGALMASPAPSDDGLFVLIERKRLVAADLKSGACAPITAEVLLQATRAVPILGNVLGITGF